MGSNIVTSGRITILLGKQQVATGERNVAAQAG